ncbi:hypothetical protein P3S68_003123 [Capsicum galapagoense]
MASSAMTQTNTTTDQLALLSLKSKIIFDPSHFLYKNWSPAIYVCHWVRVTCGSRYQRVKFMNLSNMALMEMARLRRLKFLDLSVNNFRGKVPSWFGFLHQLQVLNLGNNSFTEGSIPPSISNASRLETLELSNNSLQGNIPEGIGNLHNMNWLSNQYDQLMGSIPFTIFNISRIEFIAFTGNSLSGSPPNGLCNGLPILKGLYLWTNTLHGHMPTSEIPKEISNLIELEELNLQNKRFSGPLPMETFNISGNLTYLDISFNPLNDMLPASTGNLSTSLRTFFAISCKTQGRIPDEVGNLSSLLDLRLSGNNLHLGDIYLGQNQLSGSLPNCLGNITSLRKIHLVSNKLSSNIPPNLGNLQDLVDLDLSSNKMVGFLPPEIGNLKAVTLIDLSVNQFSNGIPREIGGLQNLEYLSLRHNKLQGPIPDSMSNMIGLEFLDLSHNNISVNIPKSFEKLQNLKYFNISINKLYGEIPSGGPFRNLSSQFFIYNEALCGSSRFSVPPCPTSAKHKSNRKKLLVLFLLLGLALLFVPISFVFVWIRYRRVLLLLRHQAEAKHNDICEYLHHGCSSPVIHCDLKPSNVLLDENMVAHLSDFGISKLLGEDQSDLYTKTLATLGYIAPEYGLDGLVSTRKPNEFDGDLSLKQWASYSLPEAVMDVVDVNLVTPQGNQKELDVVASIMKVALDCCAESPARRTNMKDVVGMLQKIKIQLLAC